MSRAFGRLSKMAAQAVANSSATRQFGSDARKFPELYFGTMTFGWNQASSTVDESVGLCMVKSFLTGGGTQIDTARIYSGGETELILGRVLQAPEVKGKTYILGTKVHPSQPGGLSDEGLRRQLETSLKDLQVDKVDVLYLHQPDTEHDLTESLLCMHNLIKEGKICKYGLSNYSALETDRCCVLCVKHGWTLPSFYQGLYNPLNRLVEEELLPVLRKNKISFIAFNPLAAGLLTGKHRQGGEVIAGRFRDNPNYLPRFYTDANFAALEDIRSACDEHGLCMVPATYSWLLRHSQLEAELGDGLLLGASSPSQLAENLEACRDPRTLPAPVLSVFDGAWARCKDGAFPYWRSYSKDQPGRESLHPGASYQAAKTK